MELGNGWKESLVRGKKWLMQNRALEILRERKKDMLLVGFALFLGRASIFGSLAPFAISYFAVISFLRRELRYPVAAALVLGSFFSEAHLTQRLLGETILFFLLQMALEKTNRSDLAQAPLIVFVSVFTVQLFGGLWTEQWSWFALALVVVESFLAFLLTLIFIQSLPLLIISRKRPHMKSEELVCLIIFFASILSGLSGWHIYGMNADNVLSRYLILLFAYVGGASMGASVGVVTGLILSLANSALIKEMSLLAFSGLLAGLLKEGNKMTVCLGMVVGSSILSIYIGNGEEVVRSTWETLAAAFLFLCTPRYLIKSLAGWIPGTAEHDDFQYDYAKRVRNMIAARVEQFSEVFRQLSKCFVSAGDESWQKKQEGDLEHFMSSAGKVCEKCWKKKQCWGNQFYVTYQYMTDMITRLEGDKPVTKKDIPPEWKRICHKTEQVLEVMRQQMETYKNHVRWKKLIADSRQLVSEQLSGVSQVMDDLAREIKREGMELSLQEEQIRMMIESLGLSIQNVDIISLEEGKVEIEMIHRYRQGLDECRKIIAPMLSDILGEQIVVKREEPLAMGKEGFLVLFGSAKEFEVETGIAGAAKGGGILSGDSFRTLELGNGKFAVAISDGMGNGERAMEESSTALTILQHLLQTGMDEKLAVKSVNSLLLLRSADEMYATVDVALVDLFTAHTTFLKIGSAPTFIVRGREINAIHSNNLPVGILQEIDVDLVTMQLEAGDVLIMMTDGVYDAPGAAVNKELWMKRMISEIEAEDPQDIADCLLEKIIRYRHGQIVDDMTIVVAKIEKYKPEWAAIQWAGAIRLERPKSVS